VAINRNNQRHLVIRICFGAGLMLVPGTFECALVREWRHFRISGQQQQFVVTELFAIQVLLQDVSTACPTVAGATLTIDFPGCYAFGTTLRRFGLGVAVPSAIFACTFL